MLYVTLHNQKELIFITPRYSVTDYELSHFHSVVEGQDDLERWSRFPRFFFVCANRLRTVCYAHKVKVPRVSSCVTHNES